MSEHMPKNPAEALENEIRGGFGILNMDEYRIIFDENPELKARFTKLKEQVDRPDLFPDRKAVLREVTKLTEKIDRAESD